MEFFVLFWLILSTLTFIWSVGRVHNYEITHYPLKNNKPEWSRFFFSFVLFPAAITTIIGVYGLGSWTWPRKGVTYDKDN
jgi:hypothetical protein